MPGVNQFDGTRDEFNELIVILAQMSEHFHFIPRHELQAINVVTKLIELANCTR